MLNSGEFSYLSIQRWRTSSSNLRSQNPKSQNLISLDRSFDSARERLVFRGVADQDFGLVATS